MYLDTAIIVKLLVREGDSEWFGRQLSGHGFESSELALTEVCAALLFKERAGDITPPERESAMANFFSMVESELIVLFPLNRKVLERARAIQVACHPRVPLRTLDALHVATCDLHRSGTMSATDRRIRAACTQLGITLIPGEIADISAAK
jgi:predicted nucleic acid-binding protein